MGNTIAFANHVQAALFEVELKGQISDGNWENAGPRGHWKPWCSATVIVDPKNMGRDFYAQRERYNFTSGDLLDVIGNRMLSYARIALIFGHENVRLLENLLDMNGDYRGPPDYQDHATSTHYADIRKQLNEFLGKPENLMFVKNVVSNNSLFNMKDLKNELRRMKEIIKMRRQATIIPMKTEVTA
jgi:hypothetical protein